MRAGQPNATAGNERYRYPHYRNAPNRDGTVSEEGAIKKKELTHMGVTLCCNTHHQPCTVLAVKISIADG